MNTQYFVNANTFMGKLTLSSMTAQIWKDFQCVIVNKDALKTRKHEPLGVLERNVIFVCHKIAPPMWLLMYADLITQYSASGNSLQRG